MCFYDLPPLRVYCIGPPSHSPPSPSFPVPTPEQNNALFMRLDSFLERCNDILDLTQTIVQFSKLAKVEVGGTKGKTLTASVAQIHHDFQVPTQEGGEAAWLCARWHDAVLGWVKSRDDSCPLVYTSVLSTEEMRH